jgi:hypothetical protein
MKSKRKSTFEVGVRVPQRPEEPAARLIPMGANFTFRTAEILGPEAASHSKPLFEGQALTVVGFKPRYVNNVLVQDASGRISMMPADMVAKGLELESMRQKG